MITARQRYRILVTFFVCAWALTLLNQWFTLALVILGFYGIYRMGKLDHELELIAAMRTSEAS